MLARNATWQTVVMGYPSANAGLSLHSVEDDPRGNLEMYPTQAKKTA
jgi:hypothetical protein